MRLTGLRSGPIFSVLDPLEPCTRSYPRLVDNQTRPRRFRQCSKAASTSKWAEGLVLLAILVLCLVVQDHRTVRTCPLHGTHTIEATYSGHGYLLIGRRLVETGEHTGGSTTCPTLTVRSRARHGVPWYLITKSTNHALSKSSASAPGYPVF